MIAPVLHHKPYPEFGNWQLQVAKSKFSELVDTAMKFGPQLVTKNGKEAVIVISIEEYNRIAQKSGKLTDFFRSSPLTHTKLDTKRQKDFPRDTNL